MAYLIHGLFWLATRSRLARCRGVLTVDRAQPAPKGVSEKGPRVRIYPEVAGSLVFPVTGRMIGTGTQTRA